MQRYFVLLKNNKITLQGNDFHHIKNVMRIASGDNIIVSFNNESYLAKITYTATDYEIAIVEKINDDKELSKKVILYQCLIKNDHFDLVLQKACELGISDFIPVISERVVISINDKKEKKLERYNKIVKEACEQSERSILPLVHDFINIKDINLDPNILYLLCYEREDDVLTLGSSLKNINDYQGVAIIIGPEGGFSKNEVKLLLDKGFKKVSLGKRILRAETAAIAALSIVSYCIEGEVL